MCVLCIGIGCMQNHVKTDNSVWIFVLILCLGAIVIFSVLIYCLKRKRKHETNIIMNHYMSAPPPAQSPLIHQPAPPIPTKYVTNYSYSTVQDMEAGRPQLAINQQNYKRKYSRREQLDSDFE
uniref:Uncharacterized protein n=1 Tax=Ditylenchus dipsaci TaxID=166011 RepID=A0A915CTA6_9BILA